MKTISTPYIILYDNDCGFCDWCRDLVEQADQSKQYTFVGIQTEQAQSIAHKANIPLDFDSPESFVVYDIANNTWSKTIPAAQHICKHTHGALHLLYYPLLATPRFISEWIYKLIARHRSTLGKLVGRKTCRIRD